MKYTVEVTQEDIDQSKGLQTDSRRCPVARALQRATSLEDLEVGVWDFVYGPKDRLVWYNDGSCGLDRKRIDLPLDAKNFVRNFDMEREVSPIRFEVELP